MSDGSVEVDEELNLQIEVCQHEAEREIEQLRGANRSLRRRLREDRGHLAVEAATAGSFAVALIAAAVAGGAEPIFAVATALIAGVGAVWGTLKILNRKTPAGF